MRCEKCLSQPYAGAWLNAVPSHQPFQVHSWALRLLLQRRLGLPLASEAVAGATSKHGHAFDVMGDLATNDGKAGHQTRHHDVLVELCQRLRTVWGAAVEYEGGGGYKDYSDTRPDVAVHLREGLWVGDVKVKDPLGSAVGSVEPRGAHVAFGNTEPGARLEVHGLEARGQPGGRAFNPLTGQGCVAAKAGAYDRAKANGVKVDELLFETFGGFGPGAVRLLKLAAETRGNKLRGSEYDATTWAARTWLSYVTHRLACALARAVAWELAAAIAR